jgi:hypothetical protein
MLPISHITPSLILQFCLLHLNKFIVRDFPRKTTIEQELIKYIVDIYFTIEIEFLSELGKKENDNTG